MKIKTKILWLLILIGTHTHPHPEKSTQNKVALVKNIISKQILPIAGISTLIIFRNTIFTDIKKHPYISAITGYFLLNYLCDFLLNISEQQNLINLHSTINEAALDLICIIALNNYIKQHDLTVNHEHLNDQDFLNLFTEDLHCSFNEAIQTVLKAHKDLQVSIEKLHFNISTNSEACAYLCYAHNISFDQILPLLEKDKKLKKAISTFLYSPHPYIPLLIAMLNRRLTSKIKDLQQAIIQSSTVKNFTSNENL